MTDEQTLPKPSLPKPSLPKPPAPANQWQSRWGNAAQIVSALASFLGIGFVLIQLNTLQKTEDHRQKNAAEAAARQVYMSYSEAALRYPKFASPLSENLSAQKDPVEYEQYKLFVGHMLFAYDEMLGVFPDSLEWQKAFDLDIAVHTKYICEEHPDQLDQYYERVRTKLIEIRKNCPAKPAPK